jgi:hypothetical protein
MLKASARRQNSAKADLRGDPVIRRLSGLLAAPHGLKRYVLQTQAMYSNFVVEFQKAELERSVYQVSSRNIS